MRRSIINYGGLMKLLSMRLGNENHAGIVIGDEVLDVSAYAGVPGAALSGVVPEPVHFPFADALDLYRLGVDNLSSLVSLFETDQKLADECREAGRLLPINSIQLNPPVLAAGKILAIRLN